MPGGNFSIGQQAPPPNGFIAPGECMLDRGTVKPLQQGLLSLGLSHLALCPFRQYVFLFIITMVAALM